MPPSEIGETLLQTSSKSVPNSCIRSNLRSARAKFRERCGSGMPSKSRKGWYAQIESPRSAQSAAMSLGRPSKPSRSFSKISTASNSALAMARNFSSSVPLSETVAIERVTIGLSLRLVTDPRQGAQLIGCRGGEAKELQIGRDLFEQHVGANLIGAATLACSRKEWRDLLLHHDFTHQCRR